jgi:hypothetical protein
MPLMARYRRAWAGLFIALLWLPMLGQVITTPEHISMSEVRALRQRPDLAMSRQDWSSFPNAMDEFLADHFGFREELIQANAFLRYELSSPISRDVLFGRNGFLFYLGGKAVQQTMGMVIPEKNFTKFVDVIAALYEGLATRKIQFLFTSPPNNSTINRRHLPRWASMVPAATEYDLVLAMLAAHGIPALDLRPALTRANAQNPVYERTDTHWNDFGALVARNEIVVALGHPEWLIDIGHALRGYETVKGGDMARFLGVDSFVHDKRPIIDVSSYAPVSNPALVIVGDSFSEPLRRVWGHGSRLVVVEALTCKATLDMILVNRPSIVVFAPNERYLGYCD